MRDVLICDTEAYRNFWCIGFKRASDGKVLTMRKTEDAPLNTARLASIMKQNTIVTFNGLSYDLGMIYAAICGCSNEELKSISDAIIIGRVRYWQMEEFLADRVEKFIGFPKLDFIDLIEPQPNAIASLKTLNGRLHGPKMRDLPYEIERVLTPAEMDDVELYMGNDLDATHLLYDALREPLALREALGQEYGMDFRSKSDSQIGETIVKKRVEKITGKKADRAPARPGTTFRYHIPDFIQFKRPDLREIVNRLAGTEFVINDKLKVEMPKWLEEQAITIGDTTYAMGIGGLHSTESNRSIYATDTHVLIDADVASYYPAIILGSGLYPKSLGPEFIKAYDGVRIDRIAAKKRVKEIDKEIAALKKELAELAEIKSRIAALEAEKARCKTMDQGGKIQLNGTFGKLGSHYSVLYAPHLMIAVTLTGQLALLMLIERAEEAGIPVVSGNTDGVVFRCPRELANPVVGSSLGEWPDDSISFRATLKELTDWWQRDTGFDLEFTEYRSIHNASVNSYFAIKTDGKVKRKGPFANPWDPKAPDLRGQMMKNPQMTICSDAAAQFLLDRTPVEETIRRSTDIRNFVTVVNVKGGGTWRDEYLGKVVRYYWAKNGEPIFYKEADPRTGTHKKVSKSDGCRPAMELPTAIPDDIDIDRYVAEATEILRDVGALDRPPPPIKTRTKAQIATALLYSVFA